MAQTDILTEDVISLIDVLNLYDVSYPTPYNWANRGVRGIKLETSWRDTRRVTSRQAVERFLRKVRAAKAKEG